MRSTVCRMIEVLYSLELIDRGARWGATWYAAWAAQVAYDAYYKRLNEIEK